MYFEKVFILNDKPSTTCRMHIPIPTICRLILPQKNVKKKKSSIIQCIIMFEICCPFQLLSYTKTLMSHSSMNTSEFCFYLRYVNTCAILLTFINLQSTFIYSVAYVSSRMENCIPCYCSIYGYNLEIIPVHVSEILNFIF